VIFARKVRSNTGEKLSFINGSGRKETCPVF